MPVRQKGFKASCVGPAEERHCGKPGRECPVIIRWNSTSLGQSPPGSYALEIRLHRSPGEELCTTLGPARVKNIP